MTLSRSPRPPSLEPALSRADFRRLEPLRDFQSRKDSTGFQPVVVKNSEDDSTWEYTVSKDDGTNETLKVQQIAGEIPEHRWNRKRAHLTNFESETLDGYTGPKFKEWNQNLRAAKTKTPDIEALQAVISKAKKYAGPVYRGLSFPDEISRNSFLGYFDPTKAYETPQFMSTSKRNDTALMFAQGQYGVFMRIYAGEQNGAILRLFTGSKDLKEDEVLFKYGSRFVVREIVKDSKQMPFIKMDEEGTSEPVQKMTGEYAVQQIPAFKPIGSL